MVNIKNMVFWDVTPLSKRRTNVSTSTLKVEVEGSETLYICTNYMVSHHRRLILYVMFWIVLAYLMMLFQFVKDVAI